MCLMIVGESPSKTRPKGMENIAFSGKTSHILWDELKKYNITREDCYVTNVITDFDESEEENEKRLAAEIAKQKPTIILAVGKKAAEKLIEKPISIMDVAGEILVSNKFDCFVIPSIHPAAVARNSNLRKMFVDGIYVTAETLNLLTKSKDNCRR
jgi:uracil-DNA glycosylase family 4